MLGLIFLTFVSVEIRPCELSEPRLHDRYVMASLTVHMDWSIERRNRHDEPRESTQGGCRSSGTSLVVADFEYVAIARYSEQFDAPCVWWYSCWLDMELVLFRFPRSENHVSFASGDCPVMVFRRQTRSRARRQVGREQQSRLIPTS